MYIKPNDRLKGESDGSLRVRIDNKYKNYTIEDLNSMSENVRNEWLRLSQWKTEYDKDNVNGHWI